MTYLYHDYLAHHGIKGQKWGVRRTPEELGHVKKLKQQLGDVNSKINARYEAFRKEWKSDASLREFWDDDEEGYLGNCEYNDDDLKKLYSEASEIERKLAER